ncbi:MAG: DNA primase [Tepidisphaeraceae bacterium]
MSAAKSGTDYKALVLQAVDLVQLVGQTVALKRRGKDYVGLCPFHNEKTPSFHVSPTKQFYRCYGCKAGGNAIDFVMARDRVEFIEAMRSLGEQAGVPMPKYGASKEKMGERQVLLEAHSAACGLFEKLLADEGSGRAAHAYLDKRGINAESIKRFQIGVALDAWDGLLRSPAMKKYPASLLQQAGLAKSRDNGNGFYDTFRNRLMFPIRDENGRVIAFGGRVMPGSEDPAKYLNSPETPLFSKSRCIFGLDLARQRIVETRTAIVVEGYTDVVMAHQFGVSNVVSILGTAMTEQHVSILRRFADKIVLLFDADTAGDTAVNRAVELFLTQPIEIAIASMPQGVDPDEFLIEHGAEEFEKVVNANASDALTFKWKQLDRQFAGTGDLTGRQKAVEEYMGTLAAARGTGPVDAIRWGQALARVSRLTEVPVDELNKRFRRSKPASRLARPASAGGSAIEAEQKPTPRGPLTARDRAERWILGILLAEPARWHEVQQDVGPTDFAEETRRKLAEIYWIHQRDEGETVFSEFLSHLTEHPALTELAVELVDEIEVLENAAQHLADSIGHLREIRSRSEEQKLTAELRRTSDGKLPEQDEIDLLKKLQDKARTPDLRRVGS